MVTRAKKQKDMLESMYCMCVSSVVGGLWKYVRCGWVQEWTVMHEADVLAPPLLLQGTEKCPHWDFVPLSLTPPYSVFSYCSVFMHSFFQVSKTGV